jgi:hypothetical protein
MAQQLKYTPDEIKQLRDYCRSERQTEILEAIISAGTVTEAAKQLGIHKRNVQRAVDRVFRTACWQGFMDDDGPQENLPPTHYLKGTSTYYNKKGEITGRWIKTNAKMQDLLEGLREFADGLGQANANGFKRVEIPTATDGDLLTVYPLADLHLGMLSWSAETREDFDTAIASDALRIAASILTEKAPSSKQAIIANIGDFFHFDNDNKMTSSGNILDVDSRWSAVIQLGVECMLYFIRLALEKHETVKVVNSLGNHDGQSALMLPFILKPYFADEPRVIIEDAPRLHHYHIFGSTCIGFHHGHKTPASRLHGCMTSDVLLNSNIDTAGVEFGHWLTGHIHHEAKEFDGILVESFRTLTAKDAYHAGSGYRACRDMQAVTYHKKFGECDRSRCSYKLIQHQSTLEATKKSKA